MQEICRSQACWLSICASLTVARARQLKGIFRSHQTWLWVPGVCHAQSLPLCVQTQTDSERVETPSVYLPGTTPRTYSMLDPFGNLAKFLQHWIVSLIRHRKEKENFCFVIQACQLLILVNTALSHGAGKQYLPSYFFWSTISYILIISTLTPISSKVPRILITSIWHLLTSQLFCNKLSRTRNLSI